MITLGIDAHKRTHTVVAVDELGRRPGCRTTCGTTTADHQALIVWAGRFGAERTWAVEDCRHLSRRLERDMLAAGERIVRVPPKLMAHARDAARTYGKSDPIDALAVAPSGAARAGPAHGSPRRLIGGDPAAGRSPRRPRSRAHTLHKPAALAPP